MRLIIAPLLLMGANAAYAQSVPPQGNVNVTFTATNSTPLKPMSIGDGKQFVVVNYSMTAFNNDGNPILHMMGGRCEFANVLDASNKPLEVRGWCTYADKDGDQIFEQCAIPQCTLTGGTGKFDGLHADLQITNTPLKTVFEGNTQAIGTKKGSYEIMKRH
ncbi:MAG: hypothetical protein JOZ84_06985 [Methylobacteriaceae bacterium]|nr:hypothetical protein [Methylobacteriaceae bacterium]